MQMFVRKIRFVFLWGWYVCRRDDKCL